MVDLCMYFYTSNPGDHVQLPGGAKLCGYGWCTSTHVSRHPYNVYVLSQYTGPVSSNDPRDYEFFVETGPFVGNPIVTAATSGTWTPNYSDYAGTTKPTNACKLPMASAMHSANNNYVTRYGGLI